MRRILRRTSCRLLFDPLLAQEGGQKAESKAPLMVSFADLKWVELPERERHAVRRASRGT